MNRVEYPLDEFLAVPKAVRKRMLAVAISSKVIALAPPTSSLSFESSLTAALTFVLFPDPLKPDKINYWG